ncbi:MAG: thermonuclease family protein [Sedimentisphaerales bacterium]|nr:thermonuclease family protein [Sedimentisphaerales bacterium]
MPLSRRLRRRLVLLGLLFLVLLAVLDRLGLLPGPAARGDRARYDGQSFRVVRVIDGDTLDLDVPDDRQGQPYTRVRLWGVDTPEVSHRSSGGQPVDLGESGAMNEPGEPGEAGELGDTNGSGGSAGQATMYYGPQAWEFTRRWTLDRPVTVRLEPQRGSRGRYGRLLAYLYLSDGSMLNEELIRQGYAYADDRFEHIHRERFRELQHAARQARRGLWRAVQPEQMPDWFRRRAGSSRSQGQDGP